MTEQMVLEYVGETVPGEIRKGDTLILLKEEEKEDKHRFPSGKAYMLQYVKAGKVLTFGWSDSGLWNHEPLYSEKVLNEAYLWQESYSSQSFRRALTAGYHYFNKSVPTSFTKKFIQQKIKKTYFGTR